MNRIMNRMKPPLMAAALVTAFTGSAMAMSPSVLTEDQSLNQSLKQDVRLVCRPNGRCFEVHRRFYEEPGSYRVYRDYDYYDGPHYGGPGIGFRFGFGGDHHR